MRNGKKYDTEKLRWDLLPISPIRQVIRVLMYGAKKYGDYNWEQVEDPKPRYYNACMRHLTAGIQKTNDSESGLPHLAHAICNLIFLLEFELTQKKEKKDDN